LKVRSLVGLLSLAASTIVEPEMVEGLLVFMERASWFRQHRPQLTDRIPTLGRPGVADRRLLAVLDEGKLRRVLSRMLDEDEFLSPYGIRSISRYHLEHQYVFDVNGTEYRVDYLPAESNTGLFGGNSNWRGPIWFPMNYVLIRGYVLLHECFHGDNGAGLGASHQTGWTGLVARLFQFYGSFTDFETAFRTGGLLKAETESS
jgi:hypothetical protein